MSFTHAAGEWVEPTVRCGRGDAGASSAVWVGIGGFGGAPAKVQQVGTDANCDAAARPVYYAWFEVVPFPAYRIDHTVAAGDTISASVDVVPGWVALRVVNRTRHWSFNRRISWPAPDTTSAEWIVEAPATCLKSDCAQAALANFGSVRIRRIGAMAQSSPGTPARPGTLTNSAWSVVPLRLVPAQLTEVLGAAAGAAAPPTPVHPTTTPGGPSSPAGAAPTAESPDGKAFTIAWVRSADGD
jgi:hypothetical protein